MRVVKSVSSGGDGIRIGRCYVLERSVEARAWVKRVWSSRFSGRVGSGMCGQAKSGARGRTDSEARAQAGSTPWDEVVDGSDARAGGDRE